MSTTRNSDTDVDISWHKSAFSPYFSHSPASFSCHTKLVESKDENWLVDLESQDLRFDERKRSSVDLDQAFALLAVCDCSGGLLLAEALNALNCRHDCGVVVVRCASYCVVLSGREEIEWCIVVSANLRRVPRTSSEIAA